MILFVIILIYSHHFRNTQVFLCFGILSAYFALGGLWSGISMGILATCVSFAFFQMNQFESLHLDM